MSNKNNIKKPESEWKEAVNWFYSDEEIKTKEMQRLNKLWEEAQPMTDKELYAVRQITWLSRCNWNLEPIIKSLIDAIRKERNSNMRIGHNHSITNDRWKKVWAYYLSLKKWLPIQGRYTGLTVFLEFCDPDEVIQSRIVELLGKKTKLKEIYVELFCYFLESKLMGRHPDDSTKLLATNAAVEFLNNEVKKYVDYVTFIPVVLFIWLYITKIIVICS